MVGSLTACLNVWLLLFIAVLDFVVIMSLHSYISAIWTFNWTKSAIAPEL